MLRTHTRITRLLTVVFFTLIAGFSGAGAFTATAQDTATPEPAVEPDIGQINVGALLCLDLDCMEFGDRLPGFEISVVNLETGEVLDTCVTQADTQMQTCVLEFPVDIPWEFAWDESQTPDGYRPYRYSHIVVEGGPISPVYYIPFVPIDAEGPNDIVVQAALCTDASCDEYAEFLDGFVIRAVDSESGVTVSECTTGNAEQGLEHQCILGMPAKGTVDIEWDAAQVPDGYEWFGSLINVADGPDGTSTTIAFVPIESGATVTPTTTPETVTSLPTTGNGDEAATSSPRPLGLAMATALALLVLGCGCYREVTHRDR